MNPTIVSALWITLIGMGLVFLALLLLWGLMALIVSVTAKQAEAEVSTDTEATGGEEGEIEEGQPETAGLHQKAAAVAVAVALSFQKKGKLQAAAGHPMLRADGESVSAWQPVLRANQLTQKSRMFTRKQRGNGQ